MLRRAIEKIISIKSIEKNIAIIEINIPANTANSKVIAVKILRSVTPQYNVSAAPKIIKRVIVIISHPQK